MKKNINKNKITVPPDGYQHPKMFYSQATHASLFLIFLAVFLILQSVLGGLHVRSGPKSLQLPANMKRLHHCHGTSGRLGLAEEGPRPAAEWQGLRVITKSRETAKSRGKTSSESKTSFSPPPQRAEQEKQ